MRPATLRAESGDPFSVALWLATGCGWWPLRCGTPQALLVDTVVVSEREVLPRALTVVSMCFGTASAQAAPAGARHGCSYERVRHQARLYTVGESVRLRPQWCSVSLILCLPSCSSSWRCGHSEVTTLSSSMSPNAPIVEGNDATIVFVIGRDREDKVV